MKKTGIAMASLWLLLTAGSANATPLTFTNVVNPSPNIFLGDPNQSFTYTHNLADIGFVPGGMITGATLAIDFLDDLGRADGPESADVYVDGVLIGNKIDPTANGGVFMFNFGFPFASLADGLLEATVIDVQHNGSVAHPQFGDFYFDRSTLTVDITRNDDPGRTVPAPGTALLLALGLTGIGLVTKMRRNA